jgi:AcrR family transcriptional regulator
MAIVDVDGRKIRAAERRAEARERLLAAATAVFAERGLAAGTTKAITERAGVAEGVLFHYFPTKTDLVIAVLARHPLGPAIRRSLQAADEQPVAERLPRMAREWLALLDAHQSVALVVLQHAGADPRVHAAIAATAREIVDLLAGYFAAHIARRELRTFAPEAAAQLLLQALGSLSLPCETRSAAERERLLDQQIHLLLHGMVPSEHHPTAG